MANLMVASSDQSMSVKIDTVKIEFDGNNTVGSGAAAVAFRHDARTQRPVQMRLTPVILKQALHQRCSQVLLLLGMMRQVVGVMTDICLTF